MRRRRIAAAALAAGGAVAVALALFIPSAGRFLVVSDTPQPADAIVVLAGSYPDRILEAVDLYKQGLAPRILICRDPDTSGFRRVAALGLDVPRPYDINRMVAERLGVPPDAVEVLPRGADSTYAEAEVVLSEALRRGYHTLIVVTSKYHSRRASEIYRFLAGAHLAIILCPARDDDFQADRWWRDRISTRRLIVEYQKWLNFQLLDRWRLKPVREPE
jgi:uncharacterized SAM-binding protein YcdF (DUF218 family)